jgi:DNA-binding response OmpR family regulator
MSADPYRVLVLDEDTGLCARVEWTLRTEGFQVKTTDSPAGVSDTARMFQPHLILLSDTIPNMPLPDLVPLLLRSAPPETLLVVYATSPAESNNSGSRLGSTIVKSDNIDRLGSQLRAILTKALASQAQHDETG